MENVILVLDKVEYKNIANDITELFKKNNKEVTIVYTEYEDKLIRQVRNWKYIGNFFQHILYWFKSFKYAVSIKKHKNSTKIICINPIVGMFLGLFNRKGKKNITLCGFLFENKKNELYYRMRKAVTTYFLKGIDKVIVYSLQEIEYYNKIFKNINKFKFVHYGINYEQNETYTNCELPQHFLFSGGASNRDYETLIKGYQNANLKVPLYIATKTNCINEIDTTGVIILKDVVLETFGDLISRSECLILSLKEEQISAGHQALLQALKENVPILINDIPAVRDYVSEQQVIFFKTKDEEELSDKITYLIENIEEIKKKYNQNSQFYYENYTFLHLLDRLIKL